MERAIRGYHRDDEGDWVAELSCGHGQHVRHRPPFQLREWVVDVEGRASRLGTPLDCPPCDRAEQPDGLVLVRSTPEWDERSIPTRLKRWHRVAQGTWGCVVVHKGRLRSVAQTHPGLNVIVSPGSTQAIPPEVDHHLEALGAVRFSIHFLAVPKDRAGHHDLAFADPPGSGGETACWAHLLCSECGAVLDGGPHLGGCRSVR